MTIIAKCELKSLSPYGQSKYLDAPKKKKELAKDYEERCWRERLHTDSDGMVFIPPSAFSNSIKDAAKYLSLQIEGKGKQTYTKNFDAGVHVVQPLKLGIHKDQVAGEILFLNSDGKRGGGPRVKKIMPCIQKWAGIVEYLILDETITEDVFRHVLTTSGRLIGIGFFRPINRGYWGMFEVLNIDWIET